jgi:hypothetical protein
VYRVLLVLGANITPSASSNTRPLPVAVVHGTPKSCNNNLMGTSPRSLFMAPCTAGLARIQRRHLGGPWGIVILAQIPTIHRESLTAVLIALFFGLSEHCYLFSAFNSNDTRI